MLVVALLAALVCRDAGGQTPPAAAQDARPNILFVLTDDADRSVVNDMPVVRDRLRDRGTTFGNAFVPFATCCPGRASILRGQYPHNHRVVSNFEPYGGVKKYNVVGNDRDNLATRLHGAGYRTALFGKYLNGYRGGYVPPGWDRWAANVGGYNDEVLFENGELVRQNYKTRHETDVFGSRADRFVRETGKPWFALVAFNSPHSPTFYEDRYADEYRNAVYPRTPAFDENNVADKPAFVRGLPRVSAGERALYDEDHRDRLRAMRGVDDQLARLLNTLHETGQADETYVVLWNDNGYHMGQHRLPPGKRTAYEEDVRYPLTFRGPGVATGRFDGRLVSGIDLMPTFLDLAGAPIPGYVDGRSLVPLLKGGRPPWRDAVLLEGYDDGFGEKEYTPPDFKAIRTAAGETYVEYEGGEKELYDLDDDPHQLHSRHDDPAYAAGQERLSARLARLQDCAAASCRAADAP